MRAISNWKAGCGKSARPVWREGQGVASLSLPQSERFARNVGGAYGNPQARPAPNPILGSLMLSSSVSGCDTKHELPG